MLLMMSMSMSTETNTAMIMMYKEKLIPQLGQAETILPIAQGLPDHKQEWPLFVTQFTHLKPSYYYVLYGPRASKLETRQFFVHCICVFNVLTINSISPPTISTTWSL
jgi:hypothetical protein